MLVPACGLSAHVKLTALPLVAALGLLILFDEVLIAGRIPYVSASLAACYAASISPLASMPLPSSRIFEAL